MTKPWLSVIIPTLDAATTLPGTLTALQEGGSHLEVIVVDGGSVDATREIAEQAGCRLVHSTRGRGVQLHAGAAAAGCPWLLFLHADSRPEGGWFEGIKHFTRLPRSGTRAGYFRLRLDTPSAAARRVETLANWRARHCGLPYGDQGLVIGLAAYKSAGGYPPFPLMEDVALVRRLGRRNLVELPVAVVTSAQRYERDGWWGRPLRNLQSLMLYMAGASPDWLARRY